MIEHDYLHLVTKKNDLRCLCQLAYKLFTEDFQTSVLTWLWQDLSPPTHPSTHPATLSNTSKVHHICKVSFPSQAVGFPDLPNFFWQLLQLTLTWREAAHLEFGETTPVKRKATFVGHSGSAACHKSYSKHPTSTRKCRFWTVETWKIQAASSKSSY